MSRTLPITARTLSWLACSALAMVVAIAGGVLPTPAAASDPFAGATGLHDRMMPADSPDAQVTTGVLSDTTAGAVSLPLGVDVSHYQGTVDWGKVAASGQRFAIMKATELGYTDPTLQTNLIGAHAAGLVIGAYAFGRPAYSALAQADAFASAIGTLPPGSLPPVLDLEDDGGLSVSALVNWTHAFLNRLQARTGIVPMIYSGPNFWQTSMGGSTAFAGYPLWEAHYTSAAAPYQMGGWSTYTLWQYTSTGTVSGISGAVDQDRFNAATGAKLTDLHSPTGWFNDAQVDGAASTLTATGWALDPDTPTYSSTVQVSVDGRVQTVVANGDRPDVGSAYPAAGSLHGFSVTASVVPGRHSVCAYAVDSSNSQKLVGLGCRTVVFAGSWFYLNNQNGGPPDLAFNYGIASDDVMVGDTDGTGGDSLIIRRGNVYYFRNTLGPGPADSALAYGTADDTVLVGDWNGDGKDTLAVRRGKTYYVKNTLTGGAPDTVFAYGTATDTVLVGDWNGDGKDTLAVRRGNVYYVKNSLTGGGADTVFAYGTATDTVLVGDWNGDGKDTLAVRRGNTYYLKNDLTTGVADVTFTYGRANDTVLVGDWNGDGTDTLGVRRTY
jgi:GH25 family lysozyme M1 (1,4-beta-N-acetylmuramidase)